MNFLESILKIFNESPLLLISILAIIVGLLIVLTPSIKTNKLNLISKTTKSAPNERMRTFIGGLLIIPSFLFLIIYQLNEKNQNTIDYSDWIGEWTVISEETYGVLNRENEFTYTLDLKDEGGELKGIIYNRKDRVQGGLSSISINKNEQNLISGKYGNNDGRKLKFELSMLSDKKSFVGRYKIRKSKNKWKLWMGNKK